MDGEWESSATPVSIVAANDLPFNKPTHWMRLPPPPSDLTIGL